MTPDQIHAAAREIVGAFLYLHWEGEIPSDDVLEAILRKHSSPAPPAAESGRLPETFLESPDEPGLWFRNGKPWVCFFGADELFAYPLNGDGRQDGDPRPASARSMYGGWARAVEASPATPAEWMPGVDRKAANDKITGPGAETPDP